MTHPKVDYNDNMVDMRDYEEGSGKKEKLRLIIGKTVIITPFLCFCIFVIGSITSDVLDDVGGVVIEDIHYYGRYQLVGDEYMEVMDYYGTGQYAVITNNRFSSVNLEGWRLNAGDPGEDFYFPSYTLRPWHSCRIYNNEIHLAFCGFSFGIERAVWDSSDCGYLYDSNGVLVDEYCR